ncbi:RING-H2 zinc finger protein (macronuclear) [Tetrahymena thermophila SB210]|uniref:RING-H2 zinc finger protein n=1 Tax=Tetrahymena thermophila (strain SB210) TaxID=312017 RepID=I7LXV6_TETTS|nr:RING-H2 zinc finger protein [Tetrahymena thermophila SB210]EAS06276.1 RING-H2 zinc finger protein [Tetrahymena thermophila SB210]|eukprot:XP_001026521.1 RING-H2 zinc finger protein [Tetrahymena thermophila SB210]
MSISAKTKNAFCICWLLIITQTYSQQQNSTNTSNQTQKYQVFGSNYLYQVNQNLSAQTFQLSLSNSYFSQRYIVIDIIILSKQDSQFQFISCLNYNQDPLQQDSFVNQGQYNCSFTDQVAQQQNLAQQLLIIDTSDPSYQQNNTIYLTVLYQSTNSIQKASLIPLPQPINYDVYVYYYSKVPCHSSCNGLNGYCNDQTGVCSCNQFYTGADCGLYLNPLNIQNDKDSTYITIQPRSQYTFSINMTNIIQKAQGQNIQFSLKKIYGASNLNIYMLFNQNQQPSPDQYQMYYSMANSYMNISNVDSLCSQFQNSTNSLSNNSQQPQSNQCFIVFNMQQLSNSKLSIIVNFGINILANTTTNSATSNSTQNNINNNTNLRDPKSITGNNSGSNSTYSTSLTTDVQSKYQAYEITIYVLVGLAFIFVAFLLLFTVCRRCQKMLESRYLSQQQEQIRNDQENQQQQANNPDLLINLQLRLKIQQKKKLILSKKRALQNYLMPSIPFQSQTRTQLDQSVLAESALDKVSQEETQKQKRKNQKDNLQLQDLETNLNKSVQLNTSLNSSKQCCSICLIEFVPQEKVQKTICSHTFHIECIQDWIQKNDNCPLCRQSFDILDMIDYLAKEKLAQAENKDQQLAIIQNKNKIEDILLTQKEQIIQFTDDDFLTIFKFFKIDKELIIQKQPKQQNAQPVANTQSDKITKDEKAFKLEESNALLNQNYDQVTCLSPTYLSTLSSPVSKFQSVYVQQQLIQSPTAELPQHSQNPSIFTLQKFSQNQQELNAQNNQKNTHKSIDNIPEEVSYPIQNQNYFSSKSQVFTKKTLNLKNKNSITHNHLKMQDENQNQYQNFANNEEQKDEQNQEYSENQNNFSSFQNQTGNQKIFTSQKS